MIRTDNEGALYIAGQNEYYVRYVYPHGRVAHRAYLQSWIANFGQKVDLSEPLRPSDTYEVVVMCRDEAIDTVKAKNLVWSQLTPKIPLLLSPCKRCKRYW